VRHAAAATSGTSVPEVVEELLLCHSDVRYVALYQNGKLDTTTRQGRSGASAGESDKYEELLVNPTILKLVAQRGDIDCGGAHFVVIRYGNFYQWIRSIRGGHASVCIEAGGDPIRIGKELEAILRRHELV
jgi:hypothetical protein